MIKRGFTLIEVLIALALIAGLSLAVMSFARDVRSQQRALVRLSTQVEQTTDVVELLERSIATCVADAGDFGAGIQGTPQSLRLAFRGVQLRPQGRLSDLLAAELRFDAGGKRIVARQWAPGFDAQGESESIATAIEYMQFRYHDGREWVDSFDAFVNSGLPRAIEVTIWYQPLTPSPRAPVAETGEINEATDEELASPKRPPDRWRIIAIHDAGPGAGA